MKFIMTCLFLCFALLAGAQEPPYVDIHSHVCLKAFHSRHVKDYDNWEKVEHDCGGDHIAGWMVKGSDGVPKYSQGNLEANALGNVRVVGWSMTPLEAQYNHLRLLRERKKGQHTMSCITGIHYDDYHFLSKGDIYYFPIILENIAFVGHGQYKPVEINGEEWTYEIVKNRRHMEDILQNPHKIAVLLNIEGGNILGRSLIYDDVSQDAAYHELVLDNLRRLKGGLPLHDYQDGYLEYPIFSMGINHFFYNGLGGQANPFKPIQNFVFKAGKGVNEPITPLGKKVIKLMLDAEEGRIIIPDVKHMSLKSRQWYYEFLREERAKGREIPVMFSHAAVAGMGESDRAYLKKDKPGKHKKLIFNNWTINLSNEDIRIVHETKGLIGLILDRFRLVGGVVAEQIKAAPEASDKRKQLYLKSIALNMLHIVKVSGDERGWDIICIGSDFDGAINSFEMYDTAEGMPLLKADLEAFFADPPEDIFGLFPHSETKELMYGKSPKELMDKVFSSNAIGFYLDNLPE